MLKKAALLILAIGTLQCSKENEQTASLNPPNERPPVTDEDSGNSGLLNPEAFSHRVPIILTPSDRPASLEDFPILIRIPGDSPIYGLAARPDGGDLRFADSSTGQELSYEIERWSPGEESLIWVRIPNLPPSLTTPLAWLYLGNPDLVSSSNGPETFLPRLFHRVYHFSTTLHGGIGETTPDSTSQEPLTTLYGPDIVSGEGFVGAGFSALSKDGGFSSSLTSESLIVGSVSLMVRLNSTYRDWRRILSNEQGPEISLSIASNSSRARTQFKVSIDNGETTTEWRSTKSVNTDGSTWNHLAWAWDMRAGVPRQPDLYIDGALESFSMGSPLTEPVVTTTEPYCVYCRRTTQDRLPTGQHDELRIYRAKMSSIWLETELKSYRNELVSLGEPQAI